MTKLLNKENISIPCDKHVGYKFQGCEQCIHNPVHHPLHLSTEQFYHLLLLLSVAALNINHVPIEMRPKFKSALINETTTTTTTTV